jgi:hypothetical protein
MTYIRRESVMVASKTFKSNGKANVTRANDVLDLEVGELGVETKLLDDTSILAACKFAVIFRFGSSNYHLSGSEHKSSCLGFTNTHNHSGKTLGVILGISCSQSAYYAHNISQLYPSPESSS